MLLAATMVCGINSTTAFAESTPTDKAGLYGDGTTVQTTLPFTKVLEAPEGTVLQDQEFTFTMTAVAPESGEKLDDKVVKQGVDLTNKTIKVTIDTASEQWQDDAKVAGLSQTVDGWVENSEGFDISSSNITFTDTGVYKYTVTETAGDKAYINYSNASFDVYLYVSKDSKGNFYVSFVQVKNGTDKTPIVFKNTTNFSTIKVEKKVTDYENANSAEQFTFWIKIPVDGPAMTLESDAEFTATITRQNKTTDSPSIDVGGASGTDFVEADPKNNISADDAAAANEKNGWHKFTLANGESMIISNVPIGMIYYLAEEDASGFDTYYQNVTGKTPISDDINAYEEKNTTSMLTTAADGNVTRFWNIKDTPDTGIVLDVMPYVVVVLLAAGCAVLLIAKKRRNAR
jgi:pilin isopeptide linkage protein